MLRFIIPTLVTAAIVLSACESGGHEITKSRYGSAWPLTVDSVTLHCENSAVWVERPGGTQYPLNGVAEMRLRDAQPLERIWRYDHARGGAPYRISIGPLIQDGLALCD